MLKEVTFEEARKIQLYLLDIFDEFCRLNNLRYSLCGGTLIGSVRHKGFIPWDDDIDVMLPRKDYEYFLSKFEKSYSDIDVLHYHKGTKYDLPFAKISYNKTFRKGFEDVGVFIDIFPIDGVPDTNQLARFQDQRIKLDIKRYEIYYFLNPELRSTNFNVLQYCKAYIKNKLFLPSWESVNLTYDRLLSSNSFEDSNYAGVVIGRYGNKEIMPKKVFSEYIRMPFEGKDYSVIKDYKTYLSNLYGDYMKLPPIEQRIPGHNHIVYWKIQNNAK